MCIQFEHMCIGVTCIGGNTDLSVVLSWLGMGGGLIVTTVSSSDEY